MADPAFLTLLKGEELRAAGVPAPWSFGKADRVRFGEIDALGHVNHTVYLQWFEALRVEYLMDYGVSQFTGNDMQIVLKSVGAQYHAPMFVGQKYIAATRTTAFRNTSFQMHYGVWCEGVLTMEGQALVVCLEQDGRTKRPLTAQMRETFVTRDGAETP
ncbi:acyl-CoA thioesterase [Alphaproteobacteria bacterium KMM 3653]|uniref:Acyl-CoA thioesterase n=1 Tax=Harenicola maris TaxID=2841044 RepID=A0AAP2G773_9RHOB|nr:acyl-CoA thioesterase [Harenicola maris]